MFTTSILSACLEDHILFDNMPDRTDEFANFRIIDGDDYMLQQEYLHIGRSRDLYNASRNKWDKDQVYTVVITDGDDVMDIFTESSSFHVVRTDKSLISVINGLSELADEYSRMNSLRRHLRSNPGIADPLIEGAARAMSADCFYLTGRFRVVTCFRSVNCPEYEYLERDEYVRPEDLSILKDEWTIVNDWVTRLMPIEYEGAISSYLLVIMHNNSREKFNSDMVELLRSCMVEFTGLSFSDRSISSGRFTTLAQDIIDGKVRSQEELNERLRRIYIKPEGNFYLIVIEAESLMDAVPLEAVPTLSAMFPNSFPVQYDNKLLLLIQTPEGTAGMVFDEHTLVSLLENYDLYACLGDMITNLRSLRPDYIKVSKCLGFARTFSKEKNRRIFRAEEYAIYNVIDICYSSVADQHHGDTIHMCCRGAVDLINYDRAHKTNYAEVLKQYLLNDKNTSGTAESFGMHRNTLMYKLDKIKNLIGEDLNDPMICFRMLFSLLTLDYLEVYQKRSSY